VDLLHGPGLENRPNIAALEEFLTRGLKYVFPRRTWRAYAGSRLHLCVRPPQIAALRDESFEELLVLADALREGPVRERKIAETELRRRPREVNAKFKS